jgi:hypothetical protein
VEAKAIARLFSPPALIARFAKGWLAMHESGTFVRLTEAGAAA